jgi:hypothetical protein
MTATQEATQITEANTEEIQLTETDEDKNAPDSLDGSQTPEMQLLDSITNTPTATATATATGNPTEGIPEPLRNAYYTYDGDGRAAIPERSGGRNLDKSVINSDKTGAGGRSTYFLACPCRFKQGASSTRRKSTGRLPPSRNTTRPVPRRLPCARSWAQSTPCNGCWLTTLPPRGCCARQYQHHRQRRWDVE